MGSIFAYYIALWRFRTVFLAKINNSLNFKDIKVTLKHSSIFIKTHIEYENSPDRKTIYAMIKVLYNALLHKYF